MFPYIYSEVNNIHILDLIQSATLLKKAMLYLENNERTYQKIKDLEEQESQGTFDLLTKKEAALRRKKLVKLRKYLDGIKTMSSLPDVVIIIDQKPEITAITECQK